MEDFQQIDIQKAKELIDQGNIEIVDVRNEESYEEGHIENAFLINDSNIEEFVKNTDKNKPLLCYCHMGFSSQGASQYFKEKGFETVYSMIGGYTEWDKTFNASEESSE